MQNDLSLLEPLTSESPKAFQAFCDYVELGHTRSFAKLIAQYQTRTEAMPTRQLSTLKGWSKRFDWQRRLKEYQQAVAVLSQQGRIEAFTAHIERAIPVADAMLTKIIEMMNDFQRLRTTRRQIIDDPRDIGLPAEQRRQIESIQTKVNTNDLQKLIQAYGALNKDLRTALGLPTVTEITGIGETVVKTYVGVSPDDWDNAPTPALPERVEQPEEDPTEEFPE